jgi:hypothetical protein
MRIIYTGVNQGSRNRRIGSPWSHCQSNSSNYKTRQFSVCQCQGQNSKYYAHQPDALIFVKVATKAEVYPPLYHPSSTSVTQRTDIASGQGHSFHSHFYKQPLFLCVRRTYGDL